jgi:hypothetical protein
VRYILQCCFENELKARQEYLYLALNTYFVVVDRNNSLIELRSFPYYDDNIVMLYGHNYWVKRFFVVYGNKIKNCLKIVTSCDLIDNGSLFVGQKNLYYSKSDDYGRVYCYEGNAFGLSFDVTTSELDFLNSSKLPLMRRIQFAYRKVA